MNVYLPFTTRLPSAYQEVEYIQGTGTQAIDCNIVIGATKLKTDLKINSQYISESAIFLSRRALNGNFLMFYNNAFRWHSASSVDVSCALNTDYSIQTENGKVTINGTSYTCTASSSDSGSDLSMCIFGKSGAPTYGRFKLYYMKMWNDTTLVRDLVPCYRKSDSVIGMYDLVNDQFYTNSGSGTFTKGADVYTNVLQNAYIGEYKTYSVDFTTATAASLQQDGFTTYGNLGLDSNGMYVSSGDNAECGVYKAIDLTGCSKFTLKFYSSLTSGSWAGGPNLGIGAISGSSFTSPYSWLNFRSNNNSGYCGEQLFYENSIIAQNTTAKSNGDYTTTIVYDFSNSTVSVTTTGPTPASYSASLSAAQVTALTQNRYIKYGIGVGGWSAGRYNRLKKVERILE